MSLKLITGNKDKFEEVQTILEMPLEQLGIDLPEIQEVDAEEIIRRKLLAAQKHLKGEYIVEDTSLYLDCLNGQLPGPLVKWFEKTVGNDGIVNLTKKLGDTAAQAKTLIGYAKKTGEIYFFEGVLKGEIVPAKGLNDFGWGPIFKPNDCRKTFGEMTRKEKHDISMRGIALRKFKEYYGKTHKKRGHEKSRI